MCKAVAFSRFFFIFFSFYFSSTGRHGRIGGMWGSLVPGRVKPMTYINDTCRSLPEKEAECLVCKAVAFSDLFFSSFYFSSTRSHGQIGGMWGSLVSGRVKPMTYINDTCCFLAWCLAYIYIYIYDRKSTG